MGKILPLILVIIYENPFNCWETLTKKDEGNQQGSFDYNVIIYSILIKKPSTTIHLQMKFLL